MEEKKEKKREELQSRREFFKSAVRKTLPILGAVVSKFKLEMTTIAFILLFVFVGQDNAKSQTICFNYKGSWSEWEYLDRRRFLEYSYGYKENHGVPENFKIEKYNDWSGFEISANGGKTCFKFKITNYKLPTRNEKWEHLENNEWFEYRGTVEYYVCDEYPTAEDWAKACVIICPNPREDKRPVVKRTAKATIKVAPYKKKPECYNIWFEGIGFGISVKGLKWKEN